MREMWKEILKRTEKEVEKYGSSFAEGKHLGVGKPWIEDYV